MVNADAIKERVLDSGDNEEKSFEERVREGVSQRLEE
jgi:hypothetical protein